MSVIVHHGDSRDVLATLAAGSIDACVTDPPYGLAFMGKKWDRGDTCAFDPDFWRLVLRALKPGGHLLAFGGSRTFHRLVCAIEDAGFEVRDQIAWIYGAGFPKSHDVSKAMDKAALSAPLFDEIRAHIRHWRDSRGLTNKALNEAVGSATTGCGMARHWTATNGGQHEIPSKDQWLNLKRVLRWPDCSLDATYAAIKDGAERPIVGHHAGPAAAAQWRTRYAGGDEATKFGGDITAPSTDAARQWAGWGTALKPALEPICLARKPLAGTVAANVVAHGTGALNIDGCRIGTDEDRRRNAAGGDNGLAGSGTFKIRERRADEQVETTGRWPANVIHDGSAEATAGFPDGRSAPRTASPNHHTGRVTSFQRGAETSPYDDSGSASRYFYSAKADAGDRLGSKHPTVKPVDLIAYLCRLITPPGGTVLDPFAGSGTTGMACLREGFDAVLIEREAEYVADIRRRIAHVSGQDAPLFAASPQPDTLPPPGRDGASTACSRTKNRADRTEEIA